MHEIQIRPELELRDKTYIDWVNSPAEIRLAQRFLELIRRTRACTHTRAHNMRKVLETTDYFRIKQGISKEKTRCTANIIAFYFLECNQPIYCKYNTM